jgi:hypothetical protein
MELEGFEKINGMSVNSNHIYGIGQNKIFYEWEVQNYSSNRFNPALKPIKELDITAWFDDFKISSHPQNVMMACMAIFNEEGKSHFQQEILNEGKINSDKQESYTANKENLGDIGVYQRT